MVSVERLAKSIVRDSLRPKEYEPVIVDTFPHTVELAEAIALECQKVGADPFITLGTDKVFYGQFKNYSRENLEKVSAHCLGLAEYVRSYVFLGGPKDPAPMARVPQEQMAAMYRGEEAHHAKNLVKKPKIVGLAMGQITRERARVYGFNYARWKDAAEGAIVVDYGKLQADGRRAADLLSQAAEVHVTADNGTDLRFRLAGPARTTHVDDGVISDEDLAQGNAEVSLPAGAAFVAPLEESAEGTFISDVGTPQLGRLIEGLTWVFGHGHVKEFTARRNVGSAQTNWATGSGAKDVIASFGLGLNRRSKPGFLTNFTVAGAVTIGIGDNRDLGGANTSDYGFSGTLVRGTVEIGGTEVIRNGRWVA